MRLRVGADLVDHDLRQRREDFVRRSAQASGQEGRFFVNSGGVKMTYVYELATNADARTCVPDALLTVLLCHDGQGDGVVELAR